MTNEQHWSLRTDREWWGRDLCRGCDRDSCPGSSETLSPIPARSSGSSRSQLSDPPAEAPSLQTKRTQRNQKKQRATGSEFLSCFLSVDSKCPVNALILYIHKAINISYSLCCDKRSHPWVGWGHMVSQEGQSVGEFSDTQSLEPLNAISLKALLPSHPATGFCPRAYKDEKSYSNMPEKHRYYMYLLTIGMSANGFLFDIKL